ncbi:MerR family transcriptional regulator [Amycolatopsis benzoatilytica]|uniref:MerR family transcriptional regulator n=1 Tax=Amycolatopsis benzoatilytica TaxID=346045 RepID=UPI00037A1930|nr:MerR family transcriptional regulator [Amycolatopsis benzoatilytica]
MFTIGEFARHGRVSVRMLRHYDALGLLRPARVDPHTGYRSYSADQLATLNRIVALKELGFGLGEVGELLAEQVTPEQVRGMLLLRRAELAQQLAADRLRLAEVEARLRTLESEHAMSDIIVKDLPATRVVRLTATVDSFSPEAITPVVRPLCEELGRRLEGSDAAPAGPLVCYYEKPAREDDPIVVHAALPVSGAVSEPNGLEVAELPAARAATLLHRGPMSGVLAGYQELARWTDEHGHRAEGFPRETYLHTSGDEREWVVELQEPIAESAR